MMAQPYLLAIDTCGVTGTLALARLEEDATVVVAETELAGKTCASFLISRISGILDDGKMKLDEIAAIAVVHGPGSFTGVRIGVAAAKALAEASGKPMIALSRLAVLCRQAELEGSCCGLLDAGRGEFYAGLYSDAECIREQLMTREEVMAATKDTPLVAAEPAVVVAFPLSRLISVRMPSVIDALPLAGARWRLQRFDDPALLDGNYLRRTDAELFSKPQSRKPDAAVPFP